MVKNDNNPIKGQKGNSLFFGVLESFFFFFFFGWEEG